MAKKTALATTSAAAPDLEYYTLQTIQDTFDTFEKDLGGRTKLIEALLAAPETDEYAGLLGILADPRSDKVSLSILMKQARCSFGTLLGAIRSAGFARAYIKTVQIIAEKTPAIVDDVLTRAAPHYMTCPTCQGTGSLTSKAKPDDPPSPCEVCNATGRLAILPELDRQKLALDLARMLPQKAPLVAIDSRKQIGNGSIAAMTDLIRATDDLLKTARPRPQSPITAQDPPDAAQEAAAEHVSGDPIVDGDVVESPSDGTGRDAAPA